MTDEVDRAQRVLEGRCASCGKYPPHHSIACDSNEVEYNRLMKLKHVIAKQGLINTIKTVKEKKDV